MVSPGLSSSCDFLLPLSPSSLPPWAERKSSPILSTAQSLADQLFINQSQIIGEHSLHSIDRRFFNNHGRAPVVTATRSQGSEMSI